MTGFGFSIWLNDLMSSPMMRLARTFSSTVDRMTSGARRLASSLRPAATSINDLEGKLDRLRARRDALDIHVNRREIVQANNEIVLLERRIARLRGQSARGSGGGGFFAGGGFKNLLLGGMVASLPFAAAAGIGKMASMGMDAEQTKLQYQLFAGARGKPLYEKLNQFANDTPFTNNEVLNSGRNLLSMGFDPERIMPLLGKLGNVASGLKIPFEELTGVFGKMAQKGFADTQDLYQFTDRGIPIMEYLGKVLGKNNAELFKMAEKKQLKFDYIEAAFDKMSAKGERFNGLLEKMSTTTGGKFSTFVGTLQYKFQQLGESQNSWLGQLFDFGTKLLNSLAPVGDAFGRLFNALTPLGDSLYGVLMTLGLVGEGGATLTGVMNGLATVINGLAYGLEIITSPFGQLVLLFTGAYKGVIMLTEAFIALRTLGITGVIANLQSLWALMLANPITAILAGIFALAAGIKYAWDNITSFREGILKLWEVAKSVFSRLGSIMKAAFTFDFAELQKQFTEALSDGWLNGQNKIREDRKERQKQRRDERRQWLGGPTGLNSPFGNTGAGKAAGTGVGKAAGVEATVSGAKAQTINITVQKLIEKSEIHVNQLQEGIAEIEDKLIDSLLRVVNSGAAIAQ